MKWYILVGVVVVTLMMVGCGNYGKPDITEERLEEAGLTYCESKEAQLRTIVKTDKKVGAVKISARNHSLMNVKYIGDTKLDFYKISCLHEDYVAKHYKAVLIPRCHAVKFAGGANDYNSCGYITGKFLDYKSPVYYKNGIYYILKLD